MNDNFNNDNREMGNQDQESTRSRGRKGGQSQGQQNNPGNFDNDREKASRAGQEDDIR